MAKSHEDAYWPDNLSLFTVNSEHYKRAQKAKLWGNLAFMVYIQVGGVL